MTIPELGKLVEVNLRHAWEHEAYSFTPWLAAHLDLLAERIGMPLELEGQEVPVEGFSADILARNPIDDSLVLIENQLGGTDHTHLGQIMTYLAGLNAHTIVWIAASFREAHLSALKWLNENTSDPFAFFAVQVKAVQIHNSPIAPVFEVLVRPNQWERQLQEIAKETQTISARGQLHKDFWTFYVNRFPDEQQRRPANGSNARWREIGELNLVVSAFLAKTYVGVFIRGPRGVNQENIYTRLKPYENQLAQRLGIRIGPPGTNFLFNDSFSADMTNQDNWGKLADWLHNRTDAYEAALREILTGQN